MILSLCTRSFARAFAFSYQCVCVLKLCGLRFYVWSSISWCTIAAMSSLCGW